MKQTIIRWTDNFFEALGCGLVVYSAIKTMPFTLTLGLQVVWVILLYFIVNYLVRHAKKNAKI